MKPRSLYKFSCFDSAADSKTEIAKIHLEIRRWQVMNQRNVFGDITSSQKDLHEIDKYYVRPGGNFFVARDAASSKIIGFVGIKVDTVPVVKTGIIKRMAVVPKYHRQGVGTGLLELALQWARKNGFAKITLTTGMRENAKPLYKKFGFQETGRIGEKRDYRMELELG